MDTDNLSSLAYPAASPSVDVTLPNGEVLALPQAPGAGAGQVSDVMSPVQLDRLGRIVEGLIQVMTPVARSALPNKTSVEIGLELKVESGKLTAYLVGASAQAAVKVTMEWVNAADRPAAASTPLKP